MFVGLPRPLLFAHRGASRHAPENTLEAFELGLRQGAEVLELDVHRTRDGELVVIHDATVERTTNGSGFVRDMTYAELARLDAGFKFLDRSGKAFFRGHGVVVPRLSEVLEAFGRSAAFNIEIKQREPSIVGETLRLLDRLRPEHVLLTAGDDAIMQEIEAAQPSVPLGLSRGACRAVVKGARRGEDLSRFRGRALQIPPRKGLLPIATAKVVAAARAAGIEVHLWTINDPRIAERLLALPITGLMSDDPGALVDPIRAARRASAPATKSI
jgi:glycerophosphoryl diester phosphodiesterase